MRKVIVIIVSCMLLAACQQQDKYPKGIEHVVIIGLDGMSSWGLQVANTPCMDSLMRNGAYSYSVRSVLPSVSTPNWTAMMSGVGPEGTGAINSSWIDGGLSFPYVAMTAERKFPNIFRIIHEQKPGAVMGSIHNWPQFANMYEAELLDKDEDYAEDADVAAKSVAYIKEKKPDFMFCYFTEPDRVMHNKGQLSPDYIQMIETLDGYVQSIVDAIHEAGIADNTLIMLMSDHGGLFYDHGGNSYDELLTPFIFSGKGVKKNYLIKQTIYRYDLAADIAFALGLTPPQQWVGRPTKAAYEGFDEPANIWKSADIMASPAFITKEVNENYAYGGLWVDEPATVNVQLRPDTKGEIRYTTDETEPTRTSSLYTAPFTVEKSSIVRAKVFGQNGESLQVSGQYRVVNSQAGNGLNYAVYHCPEANTMPSFGNRKPVATGTVYEFGFHTPENIKKTDLLEAISPYKGHIGVVYSGWIQIDTDDSYTFTIWCTGGAKLYIGDELIVNNRSNRHSGNSGDIELKKGRYPVKIEFFHNDQALGSILCASYEAGGISKRLIPADKLFKNK